MLKDILVFGKVKKFTVRRGEKKPITQRIELEFECLGFFYFSLLSYFSVLVLKKTAEELQELVEKVRTDMQRKDQKGTKHRFLQQGHSRP